MARAWRDAGMPAAEIERQISARAAQQTCEVYPSNWCAVLVFRAMQTQWRVSMSVTGLDYNALPLVFRMLAVPRAQQPDVFARLQVLEREALSIMSTR